MAYSIKCTNPACGEYTVAGNIVNLIKNHLDSVGMLICRECGESGAVIHKRNELQEEDEIWQRWIKGVIVIDTGIETYTPYIFLVSDKENGEIAGIHFNYYKDTRQDGGRLKHGHGPGGAPVFAKEEIFQLLEKMVRFGCLNPQEIMDFASSLKK